MPISILISSLFTIGRLSNNNEITIMKSAGMGLYRLLIPIAFLGLLLSAGQFIFNGWLVPKANLEKERIAREQLNRAKSGRPINQLAFRDNPNKNVIINYYDPMAQRGYGITIETYKNTDAQLLEINPAMKTSDNRIIAVDCKMTIDDNALFRQPEIIDMRDIYEENPDEVEAGKHNLNFIKLDGSVGCMVNGAGLAMATMDIIKLSGGAPANFLDVGGGANAKTVEAGFRIILNDKNVKAILINIFGGIVRCDRVANGIVEAYKSIGQINIPVIVRLQGANAEEAEKIINNSGLMVSSATTFGEATMLVANALSKR
jgi:succinyl-CoA synthetase beta subunit